MTWNVEITRKAFKQLQKLPTQIQDLADEAIESLEIEGAVPKYWDVKKLSDSEFRIRLNYRYRMRYKVENSKFLIEVFYIGIGKMHTEHHKTIKFHHILADVNIKSSSNINEETLIRLIRLALDSYLESESVPAQVIHEQSKKRHGKHFQTPGYYLKLYRLRSNLTQVQLAAKAEIRQHHLSEMENNKRTVGKKLAETFGRILQFDYHKLL